jgi:hypothetical protein
MKMMKSIKINDNQIIDDNLLDNQLEEEEEEEEEDNISNLSISWFFILI